MASPASGAPHLPDFAPVPQASLGPAVNDQGYYVDASSGTSTGSPTATTTRRS